MNGVDGSVRVCSAHKLCRLFLDALHEIQCFGAGETLQIMNDSGLTMPQIITLHLLEEKGPCTISEISDCTRLSPGATSHLVDRLVQKKLVDRAEGEQDRRQKHITLSHTGTTIISRISRAHEESFIKGFEPLSIGTRTRFADVLGLVLEEIRSAKRTNGSCAEER